ncbi:plastocyanin/azurin family domain protein [Pacificimonas flava]|uniref:Plastocyanin/azurin family domain protein n=1 Tax=Pacificimonas flava TaxID=1234595 RepID=M2SGL7_9SPHN|nr:plastocyanin/azurin family domain protein [Pacificimonas flava]EMD84520.1 plastocyanin/azurin family domain protein [Pacificimonas flava]MBB5279608.1 plastocyanin [Pacificimonas flava]
MKTVLALCIAAFALAAAPRAAAADLELRIVDSAGRPVPGAVVTVYPDAGLPSGPVQFDWEYQIQQRDIAFSPHVLIVPKGAEVSFPNLDRVRHHVYSFSRPNDFEIKLYGREDDRRVSFRHTGAVAMGCNIHDEMSAFIKVVDTPFAAKSGTDGAVRIGGIPAGGASVRIWHPDLRVKNNELTQTLSFPAGAKRLAIDLRR